MEEIKVETVEAPKAKAKAKPKAKPQAKPKTARKITRVRKSAADKIDANLVALARILINASGADITKSDLAERLHCNHGTVYRWSNDEAMPVHSAVAIVVKMGHRVEKIGNKREKEKARAMLKEANKYIQEQV